MNIDAPVCSTGSTWLVCVTDAQARAWWPDGYLFAPVTDIAHTYALFDTRNPAAQPPSPEWQSGIWLVLHPRGGSPRTTRLEDLDLRGALILRGKMHQDRATIPPEAGKPIRIQGQVAVGGPTTPEPGKPSAWSYVWYEDYGATAQIRWSAIAISTFWPDEREVLGLINSLRRV